PEEGRRRGFFAALRPWGRSKDGDDADGSEARPHPRRVATPGSGRHRGRPAPRVRRSARAARRKSNGKDDDL
ncbi:MAG: hypothetical protein ACREDE_05720, partial [Thermoplasmata archaeon]